MAPPARPGPCHWCGIDVIGDRCLFCSATPPAPEARPALTRRT
ncbi:hypothetical protein [Streptomyces sp. E1N211]|nr:hypothetical protein [Streptomyces sp. E1N211]